jgi:hypothetical protein
MQKLKSKVKKNTVLAGLYSFLLSCWLSACVIFRWKRLVSFCLWLFLQPKPFYHWQRPFFHGNRVCCVFCVVRVGTSFSSFFLFKGCKDTFFSFKFTNISFQHVKLLKNNTSANSRVQKYKKKSVGPPKAGRPIFVESL